MTHIEEILNIFVNRFKMKPRQREVILLRVNDLMTFREIGEMLGFSSSYAWQVYQDGILYCRHPERICFFHGCNQWSLGGYFVLNSLEFAHKDVLDLSEAF